MRDFRPRGQHLRLFGGRWGQSDDSAMGATPVERFTSEEIRNNVSADHSQHPEQRNPIEHVVTAINNAVLSKPVSDGPQKPQIMGERITI